MIAIFKREFKAYFTSPIGWIYLMVFCVVSGVFFSMAVFQNIAAPDMVFAYQSQFLFLIIIPLLTMRLFSEDKRQKTDQALLTAPVSLTAMVAGKLLAAFSVFAIGFGINLIYSIIFGANAELDWAIVFTNFLGIFLLGLALLSIGGFISSLTENQIVSAFSSCGIVLLLMFVNTIASFIPVEWIQSAIMTLSIFDRFNDLAMGMINFADIIYFLSITVIFSFLTIRVFEKKRWA